MFLPYLSGERTPLDDPYARGVLFGMSETTTRAEVARAVMEGVALTLAEARDCLEAAGARIERAGLIGGGAKSALDPHDRRRDGFFHRAHAGRRDRPGLGREFHPREHKTVDDGNGQITVIRRRRGELVNLTTKLNGAYLGVT